ncbi:uncharacterized protein BJ212DRAFT_1483085 [Suillus subaureus]|uniref:Uncharacterized protein n=1 Tax=Suillus subaureus TaxID=48587 RepID=A0A9P7E6U8_9AGAM|nr:uncharacterized protein BJ212DRAFT_1483085 [Suillus subaureus]KAG1812452.1 hypothetical protein BJ212DRAFT_1483085 [Suillus subaureus]
MSKPLVDSEDEEDVGIQPLLGGVPEVVLPRLSNSPRSPRVPTKKPFVPATVIAGSHLAVIEPSQPTPESPVEAPPVIDGSDILIPRPLKQPMLGLHQAQVALCNLVRQEDQESVTLPKHIHGSSTTQNTRSRTPSKAPSKAPPGSQSKAWTHSQSCGKSRTLGVTAMTTPKTQMHGCSKTITAIKAPAPAPAQKSPKFSLLSSSSAVPAAAPSLAVPAAALNLPMPDLHAMAIAIWDGTACIAILGAHVAEQDEMMTTPPKFEDASAIEGLLFECNWIVQPEVPDMSSKNVNPGDPGNLVPEYDSSNDMDVEVKVEVSSEEVDMAT